MCLFLYVHAHVHVHVHVCTCTPGSACVVALFGLHGSCYTICGTLMHRAGIASSQSSDALHVCVYVVSCHYGWLVGG